MIKISQWILNSLYLRHCVTVLLYIFCTVLIPCLCVACVFIVPFIYDFIPTHTLVLFPLVFNSPVFSMHFLIYTIVTLHNIMQHYSTLRMFFFYFHRRLSVGYETVGREKGYPRNVTGNNLWCINAFFFLSLSLACLKPPNCKHSHVLLHQLKV